ncbi:MAG: NUDIX domain-containing protein [Candidatus Paceibacterota bacterium]
MQTNNFIEATVCFLLRENNGNTEVLLAKKANKIGAGCWNGYGGKPEPQDSDIDDTCVREMYEESFVQIAKNDIEKVAVIKFINKIDNADDFRMRVHFYICRKWQGEAVSTKEMPHPTWFPINNLPTGEMQNADLHFVPLILSGKKVIGEFHYGISPDRKLLFQKVEEVHEL